MLRFSKQSHALHDGRAPTSPPPPPCGEGKGGGAAAYAIALPLVGGESQSLKLIRFPALDALVLPEAKSEYRRIGGTVASILGAASPEALPFDTEALYWCFRRIQGFEAWAAHGAWLSAADRRLGPGVRERFEAGSQVSAESYAEETALRETFRTALAASLGPEGVMLLPTVPGAAPFAASGAETLAGYRAQALTLLCWSGLSGFPQLSLPLGTVEGAPFGLSLLGPAGSDLRLLALAEKIAAAVS